MRTLWTGMAALIALWFGMATPAHATEGLQWTWDANQSRTYLLQANLRFAEFFPVPALNNKDLRAVEMYVAAVTTCTNGDKPAKKVAFLTCKITDVELRGAPPPQDSGPGFVVGLNDWDQLMTDGTIQLAIGVDGRIRSVDLEGVDGRNTRYREIQERVRLLIVRVFAGLEVALPKKGNDKGEPWFQRESTTLQLPSLVGSFGPAKLRTMVTDRTEPVVEITRAGEGTIVSGETVGNVVGERPRNTFAAALQGKARFDVTKGQLVSHDYVASAEPTASSTLAQGTAGALYVQSLHAELIPPGAKVAPLGPNLETVPGENGI